LSVRDASRLLGGACLEELFFHFALLRAVARGSWLQLPGFFPLTNLNILYYFSPFLLIL